MAGSLRSFGLLAAAFALGQTSATDTGSHPLEWLRANCVSIIDPYADGPNVARNCRVNEFTRLGTIDGRDIYYGLYRRLVSLEGHEPERSTLDLYDRPPYNNTAVAIMDGPAGARAVRVVHAFTNDGDLGESWYETPTLIKSLIGDVLLVPSAISGTGGIRDDRYFLRRAGRWAPIDANWDRGVAARLPKGDWLRSGRTDIRLMRGALLIAKPGDYNCCPTGGWMVATLELDKLTLVIKTLRRQDAEPAWIAEMR